MHIYTHIYTALYTHTHIHTHLHTYIDTQNIQNLCGMTWAKGENVLNVTQENVAVFR